MVRELDEPILKGLGKSAAELPSRDQLERHEAIGLGTEHELHMIRRLFAVLGMHPVGYYGLTIVGFPLHGIAFRPVDEELLQKKQFRVFATVLLKDLLSTTTRATPGVL